MFINFLPSYSCALQQLPKPATNSFSGVGVGGPYQTHHGNLTSYEEVAAVSAHDFTKSYNAAALGKPGADSDLSAAFKQQPYDAKPAGGSGGFNNYGLLQVRLILLYGFLVLWTSSFVNLK